MKNILIGIEKAKDYRSDGCFSALFARKVITKFVALMSGAKGCSQSSRG